MPKPCLHVIILNGVGSVGKSSTARALQAITAEPFLHVAMDAFLDMLPPTMLGLQRDTKDGRCATRVDGRSGSAGGRA